MRKFFAIDAGNSFLKLGIFQDLKLKQVYRIDYANPELPSEIGELHGGIISSVVPSRYAELMNIANKLAVGNPLFLDYKNVCAIKIDYQTPELLGADRIALAIAGYYFYSAINQKPTLIVSCGSAITVNLITPERIFKGGAIFPGVSMMLNSLHSGAEKLPTVDWKAMRPQISNHTHRAIISGVSSCIAGAINEFRRLVTPHTLVLTGGDAQRISHLVELPYTIEPELALKGLGIEYIKRT